MRTRALVFGFVAAVLFLGGVVGGVYVLAAIAVPLAAVPLVNGWATFWWRDPEPLGFRRAFAELPLVAVFVVGLVLGIAIAGAFLGIIAAVLISLPLVLFAFIVIPLVFWAATSNGEDGYLP